MKKRLMLALVVLMGIFLLSASIVWAQSEVPVKRTGQTASYFYGDDGYDPWGAHWPYWIPRFGDNGDGTVKDYWTGLVWNINAKLGNDPQTWESALTIIQLINNNGGFGSCGCSTTCADWRLPNVNELQSLLDFSQYPLLPVEHPFLYVLEGEFPPPHWTSTTAPVHYGAVAYVVSFNAGETEMKDKEHTAKTWLVRGGTRKVQFCE